MAALLQSIQNRQKQIDDKPEQQREEKVDRKPINMDFQIKFPDAGEEQSPITPIREESGDQDVIAYVRKLSKNYDFDLSSVLDSTQQEQVNDRGQGPMNSFFNGDESQINPNGRSIIIRTDSIMEKMKAGESDYGQTIIGDQTIDYSEVASSPAPQSKISQQQSNKVENFLSKLSPQEIKNLQEKLESLGDGKKPTEFNSDTPGTRSSIEMDQRLSNLKIGMQELSFIKKDGKDYNSFMDSFTTLIDRESSKKDQSPDVLLLDEDPMALFKDIVEEEFDLDEEMDEVHQLRGPDTIHISQHDSFDRGTLNEEHMQQMNDMRKYLINTICERDDEEYDSDEKSQSKIVEESKIEEQDVSVGGEEKSLLNRINQARQKIAQQTSRVDESKISSTSSEKQEQDVEEEEEEAETPIVVKSEDSAGLNISDGNKSLDSIDKLWQKALDSDEELDKSLGSDKNPAGPGESGKSKKEDDIIVDPKIKEQIEVMEFDNDIQEQNEQDILKRMKLENKNEHLNMLKSLVSFDFPTTAPQMQNMVNLKHYQRYFINQMHLAPSTDSKINTMLNSPYGGVNDLGTQDSVDKIGVENYQELGCVGFYGIDNNAELLISILILTNCSDVQEALSDKQELGCFNNIQQYLVPDIQLNQLKRSLKKIVQNLVKGVDISQKKDMEEESNQKLKSHLLKTADFGILLLLGKLYFHVCKFKQSIYSLALAVAKSKQQVRVNLRDQSESLMWLIFVQMIYVTNLIRIYKRSKSISARRMSSAIQSKEFPLASQRNNPSKQSFSGIIETNKNIIELTKDIFERYRDLKENIKEFQEIKFEKNNKQQKQYQMVVSYISLKVEIFQQSKLFRQVLEVQSQNVINDDSDESISIDRSQASNSITETEERTMSHLFVNGSQGFRANQQTFVGLQNNLSKPKKPSGFDTLRASIVEKVGQKRIDTLVKKNRFKPLPSPKAKGPLQNKLKQEADDQRLWRNLVEQEQDEYEKVRLNKKLATQRLEEKVFQICQIDSYIGCVAQSEINLLVEIEEDDVPIHFKILQHQNGYDINDDESLNDSQKKQLANGIQLLQELIEKGSHRVLASIKLWQFLRSRKSDKDKALQVAERLQLNYDNYLFEKFAQVDQRKVAIMQQDHVEFQLLVTLVNMKSLFDNRSFEQCFQLLQSEYLDKSKYTCLLYLYGKHIIKANHFENNDLEQQKRYIGSGIGALEECLNSCMPEYHSRINYYIGLAYFNNKQNNLYMPLKSIHFWTRAKSLEFNVPCQGHYKQRKIKKFIDQYQFFLKIISLVNCSLDKKDKMDLIKSQEQKNLAMSYLKTLTAFQEKVDGVSSLLLKSYIYAYTLKQESNAQECFEELIERYPWFINGYLEYWQYLSFQQKTKKAKARKNHTISKRLKKSLSCREDASQSIVQQQKDNEAHQDMLQAQELLRKIKKITKEALLQSNSCSHVTTSEWVRVRIIAAKTYLLEKKFNKAIAILTDLCYLIPPNMLKINEDRANVAMYEENQDTDPGGVRFCNQVLMEDDQEGEYGEEGEYGDEEEESSEIDLKNTVIDPQKNVKDMFKLQIMVDRDMENEMIDDFDTSVANPNGQDERFGEKTNEALETTSNWDLTNFDNMQLQQKNAGRPSMNESISRYVDDSQLEKPDNHFQLDTQNFNSMLSQDKNPELFDSALSGGTMGIRNKDQVPQGKDAIGIIGGPLDLKKLPNSSQPDKSQSQFTTPRAQQKLIEVGQSAEVNPSQKWKGYTNSKMQSHDLSAKEGHYSASQHFKKKYANLGGRRESVASKRSTGSINSNGVRALIQQNKGPNSSSVSRACSIAMPNRLGVVRQESTIKFDKNRNPSMSYGGGMSLGAAFRQRRNNQMMSMQEKSLLNEAAQEEQDQLMVGGKNSIHFDDQDAIVNTQQQYLRDSGISNDAPKFEEINDENLMLRNTETEPINSSTIFAVNSNVQFLYMIGKMCCESGHNLFQGLQALNDFYLLTWHHSSAHANRDKKEEKDPLTSTITDTQSKNVNRIKDCVKTLFCIGQIYLKLNEHQLARKYFEKIIEDRENLNKYFDCSKFVLLAEQEIGKMFKINVAANMPHHLGVMWEISRNLSRSGAIVDSLYKVKHIEDDEDDSEIKINAEHFYS